MVPVREEAVVLAARLNATTPGPLPADPAVTVIQLARLTAVHPQPASSVTVTVPVLLPAGAVWLVVLIEGVQVIATVNVFDTWLAEVPPGPTARTRAS
jgi:hypothetical protein